MRGERRPVPARAHQVGQRRARRLPRLGFRVGGAASGSGAEAVSGLLGCLLRHRGHDGRLPLRHAHRLIAIGMQEPARALPLLRDQLRRRRPAGLRAVMRRNQELPLIGLQASGHRIAHMRLELRDGVARVAPADAVGRARGKAEIVERGLHLAHLLAADRVGRRAVDLARRVVRLRSRALALSLTMMPLTAPPTRPPTSPSAKSAAAACAGQCGDARHQSDRHQMFSRHRASPLISQ